MSSPEGLSCSLTKEQWATFSDCWTPILLCSRGCWQCHAFLETAFSSSHPLTPTYIKQHVSQQGEYESVIWHLFSCRAAMSLGKGLLFSCHSQISHTSGDNSLGVWLTQWWMQRNFQGPYSDLTAWKKGSCAPVANSLDPYSSYVHLTLFLIRSYHFSLGYRVAVFHTPVKVKFCGGTGSVCFHTQFKRNTHQSHYLDTICMHNQNEHQYHVPISRTVVSMQLSQTFCWNRNPSQYSLRLCLLETLWVILQKQRKRLPSSVPFVWHSITLNILVAL